MLSSIRLLTTPCAVACQTPLPMGFSRQKYWSRLPFHSPGDLPGPGIKPGSPIWEVDSLPSEPPGKPELRSRMLLNILQYVQRHNEELSRDFPGGPVVKSVPANAGDMGSVPGQGRSHMLRGQPSPYTRGTKACEPQSLVLWQREATSTRSLQTSTRELSAALSAATGHHRPNNYPDPDVSGAQGKKP